MHLVGLSHYSQIHSLYSHSKFVSWRLIAVYLPGIITAGAVQYRSEVSPVFTSATERINCSNCPSKHFCYASKPSSPGTCCSSPTVPITTPPPNPSTGQPLLLIFSIKKTPRSMPEAKIDAYRRRTRRGNSTVRHTWQLSAHPVQQRLVLVC